MRTTRTLTQTVAARFESELSGDIGKKITYANAQRKLEKLVTEYGGKPSGTTSASRRARRATRW